MVNHPDGLTTFEVGGVKYTAVFGFKAIKAVEVFYGNDDGPKPFFEAIMQIMPQLDVSDLGNKAKIEAASSKIRLSDVGKLLEFALLKHHPQLGESDVDDLVDEIGLGRMSEIISAALSSAMVKGGDTGSSARPPKARQKR